MAPYKAAFDPPTRPGESGRSRRMGTYAQGGPPRMESNRERDMPHLSGHDRPRRGQSPMQRILREPLPRPSARDPLPISSSVPETRPKGFGGSFGFGKSIDKPSTGSGNSLELRGKSSRNVLRRKPSSIATQSGGSRPTIERSVTASPAQMSRPSGERRPSTEASSRSVEAYNEIFTRPRARTSAAKETPRVIPELDRYRTRPELPVSKVRSNAEVPHRLATQDLPPPTPLFSGTPFHSGGSSSHRYSGYSGSGYSASPSTRFSESPGPGAFSRDTTPTSMSSQSPGIIVPLKVNTPRLRQASPAITCPPVSRRRAGSTPNEVEDTPSDSQGLPPLRESTNSSSSNSTVKTELGKEKEKKRKKKRLTPPPPSPPPRKSSQKFKKAPLGHQDSPSKPSRAPAKPVMTSPSESSPVQRSTSAQSGSKNTPPLRPSREGAPDLQSQLGDSYAIIQSSLAGINLSPERRQSGVPRSTASSPLQTQPVLRPPPGSRLPSRNPSLSPVQPSTREATPAPAGLGIIPDLRPRQQSTASRGTVTRTPSPSINNPKPRFGLFGRRAKTTPEISTVETKEKASRKGPAAGTGHEGYGKYGAPRGRSSSAGAMGMSRDRSVSRASSNRDSTQDPFILERMSPVIIAGGGEIIENRNASSDLSRTESNTSLLLARPSMDSRESSKTSLNQEVPRTTLWRSALPREASKRTSVIAIPKGRRSSDSSDEGIQGPRLALRRSMQRLNNSTGALHLPPPINIPNRGISPSMSSLDASIMSDESLLEMKMYRGRLDQPKKPKKLEKRAKSPRKWNFFHRQPTPKPESEPAVSVAVGKPPAKTVPHYAMLDSSDEQQEQDILDLDDMLRDADADILGLSNEELDALQFGNYKANIGRIENVHSPMPSLRQDVPAPTTQSEPTAIAPLFSSPEPMQVTPELPKTELHLGSEAAPPRPSRLAQVGRIPKVVSARPQATSPKSFSRPFARLSTHQPFQTMAVDKESVALGPSPPKPSTPEPSIARTERGAVDQDLSMRQNSGDSKSDATAAASHRDFLVFPERKNSEATTSSSSGGHSYAGTTAVIPEDDAELAEDEVWNEFDDLIENDDTVKARNSTTSSIGMPFQYESYESRRMRKSKMHAKESPTLAPPPEIRELIVEEDESRRSHLTTSSHYSADMSSRMKDAFKQVPSPITPMSFTDFFSGYGDRNNSIPGDSAQKPPRSSQSSSRKSTSSSKRSRSYSGLGPISEQGDISPVSQVNLRVGSMTVSKWLTFGHVLFSPAREEIMQRDVPSKRHSVLVIDGLGNGKFFKMSQKHKLMNIDDWSFYAAETYPSSTFYNLSPTRPLSASQHTSTSTSFPLTPPNHRQIQHTSLLHKFPFPSSTFSVVVFRFPSGQSEDAYRNIISESKRVLKPGGYLETAILDLDMRDMGNRARRAVRGLKVKIQVADPVMSLGSASDTVLRLIGKRGFSNVKSCNVGVPVASTIPESSSSKKDDRSLADLMKDSSDGSDEGITKMVAKVGRWWYTRCYEMGVLPDGDVSASIFNDTQLLSECEKWNSSFKLVVAYAQKPLLGAGRRRGSSV